MKQIFRDKILGFSSVFLPIPKSHAKFILTNLYRILRELLTPVIFKGATIKIDLFLQLMSEFAKIKRGNNLNGPLRHVGQTQSKFHLFPVRQLTQSEDYSAFK
jgi:hypothetical protein